MYGLITTPSSIKISNRKQKISLVCEHLELIDVTKSTLDVTKEAQCKVCIDIQLIWHTDIQQCDQSYTIKVSQC